MKIKSSEMKNINFYQVYTYDPEAEARKRKIRIFVLPLVICFVIIGVTFGALTVHSAFLKNKTDELNNYLNDSTNVAEYEAAKIVRDERDNLNNTYLELTNIRDVMHLDPAMSESLMEKISQILGSATLESAEYRGEERSLKLVTLTPNVEAVAMMVDHLQTITLFEKVTYTGYEGGDEETGVWYKAEITCKFH